MSAFHKVLPGDACAIDGLQYHPGLLTAEHLAKLLAWTETLELSRQMVRGRPLRRAQAFFGYRYLAVGRTLVPAGPFPDILTDLVADALPLCPPRYEFDQCIVSMYPGGAGIGWHTDAPAFDDCIFGVSLGAQATMLFRPSNTERSTHALRVVPGSIYVMQGQARWDFQHMVRPVAATRWSFTFRCVIRAGRNHSEVSSVRDEGIPVASEVTCQGQY